MKTQELENDTVKNIVRDRYGRIADGSSSRKCFSIAADSSLTGAHHREPREHSQVGVGGPRHDRWEIACRWSCERRRQIGCGDV
jgi:hypothetical protein